MLCGLTRILSRIKLTWYVLWHKEWNCLPLPICFCCKYWETCWYEYQIEHGIDPYEPYVDEDGWLWVSDTEAYGGPLDTTVEGPIDLYEE